MYIAKLHIASEAVIDNLDNLYSLEW